MMDRLKALVNAVIFDRPPARPEGGPFQRTGTYAHTQKKPLDLHSRPIRNFGVPRSVCCSVCPPKSACLERAANKGFGCTSRTAVWGLSGDMECPCTLRTAVRGLTGCCSGRLSTTVSLGEGDGGDEHHPKRKEKQLKEKPYPSGRNLQLRRGLGEAWRKLRLCGSVRR